MTKPLTPFMENDMEKNTPVLVTTEHRGVFFGKFVEDRDEGRTVVLADCQNCLHWGSSVKGFLGLAARGPDASCRIGPPAKRTVLYAATSVSECSDDAVTAWEAEPWH